MQTFGKTLRNGLPAIGLGLLTAFGIASVTAVTAPAAMAQQQPIQAKKEFADNFTAASNALTAKDFATALLKADAALPHAADNLQKCAVEQVRVAAYYAQKQHQKVITAAESAMGLGCITGAQLKNYKQMLAGAYAEVGNEAKAVELTKQYVDEYGGDSTQYAFLANRQLKAKDYSGAISYAQKAIDQAAKESKPANEAWYNIQLTAHRDSGKMDEFYALLERVAPMFKKEVHWRPLIDRATREPKYKQQEGLADMLRTMVAAGVALRPDEQILLGEQAFNRGSTVEAEKVLEPLVKTGAYGGAGDPDAGRHKRMFDSIKASAKADLAGGLAQSEKDAASKATGEAFVATGEAYLGAGNYQKAAELIQKGIEKGQMEPGPTELAKLRLGIAQYRAGNQDAARKTWSEIKADNGAAWLARVWTAISKA
jgi:tetratricopeptide (TPR) repeat protein